MRVVAFMSTAHLDRLLVLINLLDVSVEGCTSGSFVLTPVISSMNL